MGDRPRRCSARLGQGVFAMGKIYNGWWCSGCECSVVGGRGQRGVLLDEQVAESGGSNLGDQSGEVQLSPLNVGVVTIL